MGFVAGWLFRESYIPNRQESKTVKKSSLNYHERQLAKVEYDNPTAKLIKS